LIRNRDGIMVKASEDQLREALSRGGQRFTRQRAKVFQVLCGTDRHPTAEEVYRNVKQDLPSVSLATVYKSLDALVRCGLAQKLTYGDGSARFDANVQDHPHMRDLRTGQVFDVPVNLADSFGLDLTAEAVDQLEAETGFRVDGLRIELLGQMTR
jgi:Fe2+ or Zn2+ uptake regulation protein